jgi:hypothetical protein
MAESVELYRALLECRPVPQTVDIYAMLVKIVNFFWHCGARCGSYVDAHAHKIMGGACMYIKIPVHGLEQFLVSRRGNSSWASERQRLPVSQTIALSYIAVLNLDACSYNIMR